MTDEYIPRAKTDLTKLMPRSARQIRMVAKFEKILERHDGFDPKSGLTRRDTALRLWRETRR